MTGQTISLVAWGGARRVSLLLRVAVFLVLVFHLFDLVNIYYADCPRVLPPHTSP